MANPKVNSAATQKGALSTHGTSVLGIFGQTNDLRALMRTSTGRVKEVQPGSRVGASTIVAIDKDGVLLRHSGQTQRIAIPGS